MSVPAATDRGIHRGRPAPVERGLARRPGRRATGVDARPPAQVIERHRTVLEEVTANAAAAVRDAARIDNLAAMFEIALDVPRGGPYVNRGLLMQFARVMASESWARHVLRQLAALQEHNPQLDLALVVAVAVRESRLDGTRLLSRDPHLDPLGTFAIGGLDNLGSVIQRGARSLVPPGYSEGRSTWRVGTRFLNPESGQEIVPAHVPTGELWVAYGVYLEWIRRAHLVGLGPGAWRDPLMRRFLWQLSFGAPHGSSFEYWAHRLKRPSTSGAPPRFGGHTVLTYLQSRSRTTRPDLATFNAEQTAMHHLFGGRHRYRRAWVTAIEASILENLGIVPRRLRRTDVIAR